MTLPMAISITMTMTMAMTTTHHQVALVRMAADNKLAPEDPARRNYGGVVNAIKRIVNEEGVLALWAGSTPTVVRAVLLNAGQLATYSQAKVHVGLTHQLRTTY